MAKDPPPRILTWISESGEPSEDVTDTPAIRPVKASATLGTGIFRTSFPEMSQQHLLNQIFLMYHIQLQQPH